MPQSTRATLHNVLLFDQFRAGHWTMARMLRSPLDHGPVRASVFSLAQPNPLTHSGLSRPLSAGVHYSVQV